MAELPDCLTPEKWLAQLFSSGEARKGGVVRRQIRELERLVAGALFAREVARRGFQAVEHGRRLVVFCNAAPIRRVRTTAVVQDCPLQRALDRPFRPRFETRSAAVSKPRGTA